MHPKATDEAREKWVIADPFEHWRNLAGQCSEYGKCQILSAFRHGQAMVRALRLPNLSVLSLPRSGMERYFLRIPVTQQDMNSESFAMWLLNYLYQHMDRNAPKCLVQCMREKPFRRDMFLEFPNREARSTALAFAQRAAQGAYNLFCWAATASWLLLRMHRRCTPRWKSEARVVLVAQWIVARYSRGVL